MTASSLSRLLRGRIWRHARARRTALLALEGPVPYANGVNNQLIARLLVGATVVLAERFRAEDIEDRIAAHGVTYLTGVPTMYSRMLLHLRDQARLRSLRFRRCGSAPITVRLHEEVEAAFGVPLVVSYGLSEATCTSTMNPVGARRIGTVGTPLRGQQEARWARWTARRSKPAARGPHGQELAPQGVAKRSSETQGHGAGGYGPKRRAGEAFRGAIGRQRPSF